MSKQDQWRYFPKPLPDRLAESYTGPVYDSPPSDPNRHRIGHYVNGRQVSSENTLEPKRGLLRSDGSRDGDGSQNRPESVQGLSTQPSSVGAAPTGRRFGVAQEHPTSVQGLPMRNPAQGGGGHFGQ